MTWMIGLDESVVDVLCRVGIARGGVCVYVCSFFCVSQVFVCVCVCDLCFLLCLNVFVALYRVVCFLARGWVCGYS